MEGEASIWTGAVIAIAGIAVGGVLGFVSAELSDYLRRRRETAAAALLVFGELVSAYSDTRGVMAGLVEKPEEIYPRRTAWQNHGIAIARALKDDDVHRIDRAYNALDDLDRVLRAGAPAAAFKEPKIQDWLQTTVATDLEAAITAVGRLTSLDETMMAERIERAKGTDG